MPSYDTDHCGGPQDVGAPDASGDLKTKLAAFEGSVDDMVPRHTSRLRYVSTASFM